MVYRLVTRRGRVRVRSLLMAGLGVPRARFALGVGVASGWLLVGCMGELGSGSGAGVNGAEPGDPLLGPTSGMTGDVGSVGAGSGSAGAGNGASGVNTGNGTSTNGVTTPGSDGTNGSVGGGDGTSGNPAAPVTFTCNSAAAPPPESLRRLTMTQYANTIADLVQWAVDGDSSAARQVNAEIAPALTNLPVDVREPVQQDLHGSYRRLDQTLQQIHVDGAYQVGVSLGAALTDPAVITSVVGECVADDDASNDAACLDSFIADFGARVLRRPLVDEDLDFYRGIYGSDADADPAAYADVIGVMVNAPEAFYFVEHGATPIDAEAGVYELSPYELASRLSYQLWQTAPDDELAAAAEDGSLADDETYREQVDRMLADPRARATVGDFFADWMKVEALPRLDAKNMDPVFQAFAGNDLPDEDLRQAMIDDVVGLLDYHTWASPGTARDLFTTELSFARNDRLAAIYGVEPWSGEGTPPSFPAGERPGLLTRALFLATGSPNTRPIMKGVFIRRSILCDELGDPPADANASPPELEPGMTTRETVTAITEMPGTVCAGCHAGYINPLGFATEGFDSLGRTRTEQRLFDEDGEEVDSKPVDTRTVPYVNFDDETAIDGPAELMTLIADSGKGEACLARNFFRFTYARWEDPSQDGCALEATRQAIAGDGKVQDIISAAVLTDAFHRRVFE